MIRFSSLFFILILTGTSHAIEKRRASFLANEISFLSAHEAQSFLAVHKETFQKCYQGKDKKADAHDCQQKAIGAVRAEALKDPRFRKKQVRHNITRLRADGHLSRFDSVPDLSKPSFGVVGDSLAVGAMAAEYLEPHAWLLLRKGLFNFLFAGQNPTREQELMVEDLYRPPSRVLRILDSPNQMKKGMDRYLENKGSQFIDCEECAFSYSLARGLGIPASNIFVAGQSGKRIDSIEIQMERLTLPLGHLPEKILVSYTANDICHPENANITSEQKYQQYRDSLVTSLENSLKQHRHATKGTKVMLMATVDVGNLLENKSLLSKEVNHYFPGGPNKEIVTCDDIRSQRVGGAKELTNMCPYILGTKPDDIEQIQHIKSLHQAIVKAQSDAIAQLNQKFKSSDVEFQILEKSLDIEFGPEDISPDCFHPSTAGHDKIAEALLKEIREN